MKDYLALVYLGIGFISASYIFFMYLRGACILMKKMYTAPYVQKSSIKIQFGFDMGIGYTETWWGALFITGSLTIFHMALALIAWPLFSIWVISYTIKVAREKKFGDGRYY